MARTVTGSAILESRLRAVVFPAGPARQIRDGDRLVPQERCDYLRPTVLLSASPDTAAAGKEYMFPFVTVVDCPQDKMIAAIGQTLVATGITEDEAFRAVEKFLVPMWTDASANGVRRFWRGDPARSHEAGAGMGLGLTIVNSIVTDHNGRIAVTNKKDGGAMFTIEGGAPNNTMLIDADGDVGLGTGTLCVYGQPNDTIRFYEIDAEVERLARTHFTYLDDCAADVSVAIGDARIVLERELDEAERDQSLDGSDRFFMGEHRDVRDVFHVEDTVDARMHECVLPGDVMSAHIRAFDELRDFS